jgi:hypothetical protein
MRFHFRTLPCLLLGMHCGSYHNVKTFYFKVFTNRGVCIISYCPKKKNVGGLRKLSECIQCIMVSWLLHYNQEEGDWNLRLKISGKRH